MMMAPRPRRSLLPFALLLLLLCQGFLPTWAYVSVSAPLRSSKTTTTTSIIPPVSRGPLCRGSTVAPLHVALSLDQAEGTKKFLIDEESTRSILAKAREMAFSEATSAADARLFLNRILEVQSACVSGVLASRDVCDDNIAEVAEVVAHLRRRIEQQAGNGNDSSSLLVHSDANQAAVVMAVGLFPLSLLGLLMGLVVVSTIDWHTGAVPFTAHEWILATQGGYLHTMIDHYIRNGGL